MDSLLAKYIALATHGTVWLRDRSGEAPELQAVDTAFTDVNDVSFDDIHGTARWLASLAKCGVSRIWLSIHQALRYSIGRPHEPRWWLMVRDHQVWHASLGAGTRTAAGSRTRTLAFSSEKSLAKPEAHPMSAAIDRLERQLERAAAFARGHGLAPWDTILAQARDAGSAQSPTLSYGDLKDRTPDSDLL